MPVVTLSGLSRQSHDKQRRLREAIVSAVVGITELEVRPEWVTVSAPVDAMAHLTPKGDIVVEVSLMLAKPGRTLEVRRRLARALRNVVKSFFTDAHVECSVRPLFDTEVDAFCSNDE